MWPASCCQNVARVGSRPNGSGVSQRARSAGKCVFGKGFARRERRRLVHPERGPITPKSRRPLCSPRKACVCLCASLWVWRWVVGRVRGEVSVRSLLWGSHAGAPDRGIVSSARPQIVLFRVSTKT